MDDLTTKINKSKEDDINVKNLTEKNKQNSELTDVSIFDDTLKEINQILNNLEKNSEVKKGQLKELSVPPQIKSTISKIDLKKNETININNEKNETINEIEEHKIDKNILSNEELDYFKKNDEKKKKNYFFLGYPILIIGIFFSFYGIINISKNLIISKYPMSEAYIGYFFETIKIINITILSFADFIKNIILN